MLRWLILLVSLILWVACMATVYIQSSPREVTGTSIPGTEAALDALFDEQAQPKRAWKIFIDLERLQNGKWGGDPGANQASAKPAWNGVNENALTKVGEFESTLKRKHATRLEQSTTINVKVPREIGLSALGLEKLQYKSWADIGIERGLETFNSTFKLGNLFEVNSLGSREGDGINITQVVFQSGKMMLQHTDRIPVSGKAAPELELIPFQDRPGIKDGFTFDIVMLDTSTDLKKEAKPKMVSMKVTCSGPKRIQHNGAEVAVFEASTSDGLARAWYSADGIVLKQDCLFAGVLEVMLVKVDPKELRHRD